MGIFNPSSFGTLKRIITSTSFLDQEESEILDYSESSELIVSNKSFSIYLSYNFLYYIGEYVLEFDFGDFLY